MKATRFSTFAVLGLILSFTVIMGVKAEDYKVFIPPGDEWLVVIDDIVKLAGLDDVNDDLLAKFSSNVIEANPVTEPVSPPSGLLDDIKNGLDGSDPNSPAVVTALFVQALVKSQLITEWEAERTLEKAPQPMNELLKAIIEALADSEKEDGS